MESASGRSKCATCLGVALATWHLQMFVLPSKSQQHIYSADLYPAPFRIEPKRTGANMAYVQGRSDKQQYLSCEY